MERSLWAKFLFKDAHASAHKETLLLKWPWAIFFFVGARAHKETQLAERKSWQWRLLLTCGFTLPFVLAVVHRWKSHLCKSCIETDRRTVCTTTDIYPTMGQGMFGNQLRKYYRAQRTHWAWLRPIYWCYRNSIDWLFEDPSSPGHNVYQGQPYICHHTPQRGFPHTRDWYVQGGC